MSDTDDLRRAGRLLLSLLEMAREMGRSCERDSTATRLLRGFDAEIREARQVVVKLQRRFGESITPTHMGK